MVVWSLSCCQKIVCKQNISHSSLNVDNSRVFLSSLSQCRPPWPSSTSPWVSLILGPAQPLLHHLLIVLIALFLTLLRYYMSLIVHSTYLLLAMTTLPCSMFIPSISSNDFLLNRIRAMSTTLSCLDGCCWPRRRWICFVFRQISELFFTAASQWNQGHFLGGFQVLPSGTNKHRKQCSKRGGKTHKPKSTTTGPNQN